MFTTILPLNRDLDSYNSTIIFPSIEYINEKSFEFRSKGQASIIGCHFMTQAITIFSSKMIFGGKFSSTKASNFKISTLINFRRLTI
jgi:hypothetical protein